MGNRARSITALCIALVSATCGEHEGAVPTEPALAPHFAKGAASLEPATLQLCKVAGPGIATGAGFEFDVALSGVSRMVSVATGECILLTVPREGVPLSKGFFHRRAGDVADLLPAGSGLRVDGVLLRGDELLAILGAGPGVQATSSLLLNLAQQLIAADLNILRGVQATSSVLQAIADANGAIQIDAGPPIAMTTTLDASALSVLVDVLAAFNEGRPKPPAPSPTASLFITETISPLTQIASIDCSPPSACSDADPAAGTVTVAVTSGGITTVSFTNRSTIGTIRICKSAGQGLEDGLPFDFTATGTDVVDSDNVTVDTGDCGEMNVDEGNYLVTEAASAGSRASGIGCSPGPLCSNIDLAARSVEVTVAGGSTATISFVNSTTFGTLRICKSAGPGVAAGTAFQFTALALSGKAVPMDLAVNTGECGELSVEEDDYEVFEHAATDVEVSGIGCAPGHLCGDIDVQARKLELTIVASQTTNANFTNRSTRGTLRICKTAGPGVAAGTPFEFTIIALSGKAVPVGLTVAADDCGELSLVQDVYEVFEHAVTDVTLSGIGCTPLQLCGEIDVQAAKLELTVVGNQTTTASFTNRSSVDTGN